jgi:hypothetical protein
MVVQCGRVVRVSVHGGILIEVGSSWGKSVITPYIYKIYKNKKRLITFFPWNYTSLSEYAHELTLLPPDHIKLPFTYQNLHC